MAGRVLAMIRRVAAEHRQASVEAGGVDEIGRGVPGQGRGRGGPVAEAEAKQGDHEERPHRLGHAVPPKARSLAHGGQP